MLIKNKHYRTIWYDNSEKKVKIINQHKLPFVLEILNLESLDSACHAIQAMQVRGAGLIGATGAFAYYLASLEAPKESINKYDLFMAEAVAKIMATRPTAYNLTLALHKQVMAGKSVAIADKATVSLETALEIAEQDADFCKQIGLNGYKLIQSIAQRKKGRVRILTHCNAGWLAFVDYGSALAPIYEAFKQGLDIEVWVDETRPRNQGASLTAFELSEQKIPHKLICDNTGGHLMQHGMVDMVIVGADCVSRVGEAVNKIGTYLKALAAYDNNIPFYVAFPSTTFDFKVSDGLNQIPIELRNQNEVRFIQGKSKNGKISQVQICPDKTEALNYAFDCTPNRLITKLITERGICDPNEESIIKLFPEAKNYV